MEFLPFLIVVCAILFLPFLLGGWLRLFGLDILFDTSRSGPEHAKFRRRALGAGIVLAIAYILIFKLVGC